jgi:glycosyltransferase involved in cell wall biosynthesis
MVPFLNIFGLKHLTRFVGTFIFVAIWSFRNIGRRRFIVMHGVQSCKLWGVLLGQILCPSTTVPFLTDNLAIPLAWEGRLIWRLRRVDAAVMKAGLKRTSGVIAMTDILARILVPGRPSIIMPAIQNMLSEFTESSCQSVNSTHPNGSPISVVYAGGLYRESGIDLLAQAFMRANRPDKRLIIYGAGELESRIRSYSTSSPNILFMGFVSSRELAQAYNEADILINPHLLSVSKSLGSFPSKLIEYLCTGKPVISTNMPVLSDEFKKHLVISDSDSADEMMRLIDEVSNWDINRRAEWRTQVMEYVKRELSPEAQGARIREFTQLLSSY